LKGFGYCRYWGVSKRRKEIGIARLGRRDEKGRYTNDMMNTMNRENNGENEYGQRMMKFPKVLFLFLSVLSYVFLSHVVFF